MRTIGSSGRDPRPAIRGGPYPLRIRPGGVGSDGMGIAYALPTISASSPTGGLITVVGDRVAITGDVPLPDQSIYCSIVPISLSITSSVTATDRVGSWAGSVEMKLLFYSGVAPAPQVGSATLYVCQTSQNARIRYVVNNAESGNANSDFIARAISYSGATHVAIQCGLAKSIVVGSFKLLFAWDL